MRIAGRPAHLDVRECAERRDSGEENGTAEKKVGAALLGAEAPATKTADPTCAHARNGDYEESSEGDCGERGGLDAGEEKDAGGELDSGQRGERDTTPANGHPIRRQERRVAGHELRRARPQEGDRDDETGDEVERQHWAFSFVGWALRPSFPEAAG